MSKITITPHVNPVAAEGWDIVRKDGRQVALVNKLSGNVNPTGGARLSEADLRQVRNYVKENYQVEGGKLLEVPELDDEQ